MGENPEDHGIRATIDGQALSLFIDYDRPRLSTLSPDGRLEYFRRRFEFVVLEPLAVMLDENDAPRHEVHDCSVLLVWGNVLLNAVEALGHFLSPQVASNSQSFQTFLTAFMDPAWKGRPLSPPQGIESYGKWLWDSFRNGLAHGAYIKTGGFEKLGDRLFVETESGLRVDPWALDIDFRGGFKKMLFAVGQPDNYFRSTFVERFNWTYILGEE
jgi:hypothetical protein